MKRSPMNKGGGLSRGRKSSGLRQSGITAKSTEEMWQRVSLVTKGPIKGFGKVAMQRRERRQQWEIDHPPILDYYGNEYYLCHICIYFGEPINIQKVTIGRMVLDHIEAKGHLTLEESEKDSNLGASHWICNGEKGSQQLWQMKYSPLSHIPNPHTHAENELPF